MLPTYLLCGIIYTGFYLAYEKLSPKFESERKKAYILSSISSCVMTLSSIPFFLSYLIYGLEETFHQGQLDYLGQLGEFCTIFFGVYLFADLSIGYVKYRSQVGLLTGWIHHTVYIGLMFYTINAGITPIFLTGAIMELPTFDLAISNLFPAVRNDFRFLSSFFIFRILYHTIYLIDCARPSSRAYMGNTWIPTIMLSLALLMHISWFKGGIMGYLKRHNKAKLKYNDKKKNAIMVGCEISDPVIECAIQLDETVNQELLLEENENEDENGGKTPDDSPLITPRTPKQNPLLTNLPIPNLSNLPTVLIPSINNIPGLASLTNTSANGFKEAVKHRWDEQKEKFTQRVALGLKRRFTGDEGDETMETS
ncbi:uncharacterized protein L201_004680 [Kwoniella dendrophila CBS 6074]|uniref:TLC domain-containing protein n=1 Tax=Kwoniella dendrophila CBS 6074 TaxID=1295534 RepID=A0AAX4JY20_9TREE